MTQKRIQLQSGEGIPKQYSDFCILKEKHVYIYIHILYDYMILYDYIIQIHITYICIYTSYSVMRYNTIEIEMQSLHEIS